MKIVKLIAAVIAVIISVTMLTGCSASCGRVMKDWDNEFNNGINREITVYSATGEEVWHFEGKFDIVYTDGRVLFDDENNLRHVIYFQNGTVIVNEV